MSDVIFSLEELMELSKSKLRRLSDFYGLSMSGTKDELVSRLDKMYRPPVYRPPVVEHPEIETESEMSVRIKRIKESVE